MNSMRLFTRNADDDVVMFQSIGSLTGYACICHELIDFVVRVIHVDPLADFRTAVICTYGHLL